MRKLMLATICSLLFFGYSCNKPDISCTESLTGKWLLTQYYDGYVNGGHFVWNAVPLHYAHMITFGPPTNYEKTDVHSGEICKGHFDYQNGNELRVVTSCNTEAETMSVGYYDNNTLIIGRQVSEGVIRYKYKGRP